MSTAAPATWIDACRAFAREHRVDTSVLAELEAFVSPQPRGGPPPPPEPTWKDGFVALEEHCSGAVDVTHITHVLAPEAEGRQPATFARRTAVTEGLLRSIATPAARILRVGLCMRLRGILEASPPRLRRVRALADFYYSHAARLMHPQWSAEPHRLAELVGQAHWESVAAGLEHMVMDGLARGMPVHVNVLRIDPRAVRLRVRNLTAMTEGGQSFAEACGPTTLAAISGGFFLYSEEDIAAPSRRHDPVGLLLREGVVHNPPVFARAALLAGPAGEIAIRRVALAESRAIAAGVALGDGTLVNRAQAQVGPDEPSVAVVGRHVVAVGRRLPVPLNGFVAAVAEHELAALQPGAVVAYVPPEVAPGVAACEGIAGGPLLLREGQPAVDMRAEDFWASAPPITFSQDETGDRNLLARMVAGLDAEGRLLLAAIDGRNVERALGMTLADAGRLMSRLGCHTAMNLDGGSSKRMLVRGRIVDLPSTEIVSGEAAIVRVRPVHSALCLEARG